MMGRGLYFIFCLFGVALCSIEHQDPAQRSRYRRYAPARNHHALLQDTITPLHYDLTIRPDIYYESIPDMKFNGNVTITIKCLRPTNRIKVHATELTVDREVKVVGGGHQEFEVRSTDYNEENSFLTFHLNRRLRRGMKYRISMSFSGDLTIDLKGLYVTGYRKDNKTNYMAITQMEPHFARRMFPCFDEPALKATFSITILRKASHISLSNMPLLRSNLREDGWMEDTFDKTPLMTTYLVAIAVTDYKFVEKKSRDGTKIRIWAREDMLHATKVALETAVVATDWFHEYTGIKYALPKMDHIAVPDFAFGGMENWGLITYSVGSLLFDEVRDPDHAWNSVTNVVVHEVAHQWFGNLVTAKWWNEIWINEALTSYMVLKCIEAVIPKYDVVLRHIHMRESAFEFDGYQSSHPIDYSVVEQSELENIFDQITYVKGCLVLMMLEGVIGKREFRTGIQSFLNTHKYSNADQYDLYDAFNEALHTSEAAHLQSIDVGEFLSTWVQQAGYPVVSIIHDERGLTLNQSRFILDPNVPFNEKFKSPFDNQWIIPLFISTNKTGKDVESPTLMMHDEEIVLSDAMGFKNHSETTWVIGNHDLNGYYIVDYNEKNWHLLSEQLVQNLDAIPVKNRAQMISDTAALVRSGRLHLTNSLQFMRYLRQEKNFYPWNVFFSKADTMGEKLRFTSHYGILRSYVLDLIGNMFKEVSWQKDEETPLDVAKLHLQIIEKACQYDHQPCLDKALQLFKNRGTQSLAPDTRRAVFCAVSKAGSVEVWDEMYDMYIDRYENEGGYSTLVSDLAIGVSCSQEAWILKRYLEREMERQENVYVAFFNVGQNPVGGRVALKLILENWDVMKEEYVIDSVCEHLATKEDLNLVQDFIKANEDEYKSYRYFFDLAVEQMEANIEWAENDGQKIVDLLNQLYKASK